MQSIIIITGFPGSGKSTYLKTHESEFGDAFICDDYYKSAPGRIVQFDGSIYFDGVRNALMNGRNVVIADIVFCEDDLRIEMQEGIARLIEELGIKAGVEYRYFENNPEACIANILLRNRKERVEGEIKFIQNHRDSYHIPDGAVILPVYRP